MPTVLTNEGFRFFFYSNENDEPIHVHVESGSGVAKIWLEPEIKVAYMHQLSPTEQRHIMELVMQYSEYFKSRWYGYFSQ